MVSWPVLPPTCLLNVQKLLVLHLLSFCGSDFLWHCRLIRSSRGWGHGLCVGEELVKKTEISEESYFIRSSHLLRLKESGNPETLFSDRERSSVVENWVGSCQLRIFRTGGGKEG